MNQLSKLSHKIVAHEDVTARIREWRSQGKKIGFTNGCFDILHKGHVVYLAQSAGIADVLVVGLNSDASVRRQGKGDDRPVNNYEARATVLAGLESVDLVVEFDDDTPEQLVMLVQPDVLIKGADYDPDQNDPGHPQYIVGREVVLSRGGKVEVIPLVEGFSTTSIIKKLKK